jgi:hypothetical protein
MRRRPLRWLLGLLHLAFWLAVLFVLVCLLGSLRWLKPGLNPTGEDLIAFGYAVLGAIGLFTVFYVYDTFWGERQPAWESAAERTHHADGAHSTASDPALSMSSRA